MGAKTKRLRGRLRLEKQRSAKAVEREAAAHAQRRESLSRQRQLERQLRDAKEIARRAVAWLHIDPAKTGSADYWALEFSFDRRLLQLMGEDGLAMVIQQTRRRLVEAFEKMGVGARRLSPVDREYPTQPG